MPFILTWLLFRKAADYRMERLQPWPKVLGEGGAARENGKIVSKPLGHKSRWVEILG
jgi:hypothetical protein